MFCNPISYYPTQIDEMFFFQDNNLEKVEIINHYDKLIAQGKYSEASDFIGQQEDVYGFFADFFNLIENRIYNTQEYLLIKPPKKQPFVYYNEKEHFSINDLHVFAYIEEEDTPMSKIHIFTDTDDEENLSSIKLFAENDDGDGELIYGIHIFSYCYNEIEEDISSIVIFSDNEVQESIYDLYIFTGEEGQPPNANKDIIWI